MSKYEPTIAEVLADSRLIDNTIAKIPTNPRRNAKGIVLRQRVGFSKGSYATLRNLKNFYKPLNEGKSPSHSLIIRRALDLLDNRISSIRNTKDLYEESEVFNVLASRGKWEKSSKYRIKEYDYNGNINKIWVKNKHLLNLPSIPK